MVESEEQSTEQTSQNLTPTGSLHESSPTQTKTEPVDEDPTRRTQGKCWRIDFFR